MQTIIFYILSFLTGGVIAYLFAKSQFNTKDQTEKVNELQKELIALKLLLHDSENR